MLRHLALSGVCLAFLVAERAAAAESPQPTSPTDRVIRLFNGRDLAGWYLWLKGTGHKNPHKVFSVQDGAIHASGEALGYLATERAYKDYRLIVAARGHARPDKARLSP